MQTTKDNSPRCRRCGDCCRHGGPALHSADMPLIQDGTIQLTDIVALRRGEWAYDQPLQSVVPLEAEMLKLKGRDGKWTCTFFSPSSNTCGIYETRPAECEVLFCRDTEPLKAMYDKDRLVRTDLLPEGHAFRELIAEHDERCDPVAMEAAAKAAREGDAEAGATLKAMVVYDMEMRRLVPEKTGMPEAITDFLFGRPLKVLLKTMNITIYEMGDTIRLGFAQGE